MASGSAFTIALCSAPPDSGSSYWIGPTPCIFFRPTLTSMVSPTRTTTKVRMATAFSSDMCPSGPEVAPQIEKEREIRAPENDQPHQKEWATIHCLHHLRLHRI